MAATAWSVLPPIITIVLALWTKEVYMSLIIGIFSGALLFTGGNILESILTMFTVMSDKVGSNVNILVFLVILGILVAAISRSGATRAYGEWASKTIKGQRSALLLTALLGIVIFIDDYFNCLTVGTVMRPVTDKLKVARTKLAYIIDATAAPICIIAPVSSWAAAVGSSLPEDSTIDGFSLFLQSGICSFGRGCAINCTCGTICEDSSFIFSIGRYFFLCCSHLFIINIKSEMITDIIIL